MKAAELSKLWGAPDNSRLTPKQQSFRLPVHVAAKIDALCEIYPNKSKTEIVGDLLATALEDVIANLPADRGRQVGDRPETGAMFEECGLRAEFRARANKRYKEMERELGNKNPGDLYSGEWVITERAPND